MFVSHDLWARALRFSIIGSMRAPPLFFGCGAQAGLKEQQVLTWGIVHRFDEGTLFQGEAMTAILEDRWWVVWQCFPVVAQRISDTVITQF